MGAKRLIRINAAVVALSLIITAPGAPAWAATAAVARPRSVGAALSGRAGGARAIPAPLRLGAAPLVSRFSFARSAPAAASASALSAQLPAPGAFAAPAGAFSVLPAAAARASAARPAVAVAAARAEGQAPSSADASLAAAAQGAADAASPAARAGLLAKLGAIFDGMKGPARPLAVEMMNASAGSWTLPDSLKGAPRFRKPGSPIDYVQVVVRIRNSGRTWDPDDAVRKISEKFGFEETRPRSAVKDLMDVTGDLPASEVENLRKEPGIVSVEAPRPVRALVPTPKGVPGQVGEPLLRGFVRRKSEKSPLTGATLVTGASVVALLALSLPAIVGVVVTATPLVVALKPALLLGAAAGALSFSFFAPYTDKLVSKLDGGSPHLRAILAYAPITAGAALLGLNAPSSAALFFGVNSIFGMVAAHGAIARRRMEKRSEFDQAVFGPFEGAFHGAMIGLHLLLLPMSALLGPGLTLAALLVLAPLLMAAIMEREQLQPRLPASVPASLAPTLGLAPVEQNGGAAPAAPAPLFEPAQKRITALEKLSKTDPEAAFQQASDYLLKETDRRHEVRISAMRALEGMPLSKVLPVYLRFLKFAAAQQYLKTKHDKWWYYQWEILRRMGRDFAAARDSSDEALKAEYAAYRNDGALLEALRAARADYNKSVRPMAGHVLEQLGQDPGPEIEPAPAAPAEEAKGAGGYLAAGESSGGAGWKLMAWLTGIIITASIVVAVVSSGPSRSGAQAPAPRPAVEQPISPEMQVPPYVYGIPEPSAMPARNAPKPAPAPAAQPAARQAAPQAQAPAQAVQDDPSLTPAERAVLAEERKQTQAAERGAAAQEQIVGAVRQWIQRQSMSWLWSLLPMFLLIGAMFYLQNRQMKQMSGAMGGNPGKTKGKGKGNDKNRGGIDHMAKAEAGTEKPTVRFHDIAGIDESMVEVEEVVDYLLNPQKYERLGAKPPKGVLLEGPPGSGKTMLAKALAGETNANFLSMNGSDFVQMYVGVGAARVRDLFEQARQNRPAVIFIDEIDAVGKKRSTGIGNTNDEREQTINALLAEMDGFGDSTGVIVVAATNRVDMLDDALVRPGRFDRKIHVGAPEVIGREAIIAIHAANKRLAPEADLRQVARRTRGKTGAYLANVVNEAAQLASRRGADAISAGDLDEGTDRATIGAKRSLKIADDDKWATAYHEAGHVLASMLHPDKRIREKRTVNKLTVVPHGPALGFAEIVDAHESYSMTRSELVATIEYMLGGLAAEYILYGEWSTGPGNDLQQATKYARMMVERLGMDEDLGLIVTAADESGLPPFGDNVKDRAHAAASKILEEAKWNAIYRLKSNIDRLDLMSQGVFEKETLIGEEIEEIAWGELSEAELEARVSVGRAYREQVRAEREESRAAEAAAREKARALRAQEQGAPAAK